MLPVLSGICKDLCRLRRELKMLTVVVFDLAILRLCGQIWVGIGIGVIV